MLEQKEMVFNGKTYILAKFPAVAGRRIVTQYPMSALPKVGDYQTNEDIMLKIMCYVGVKINDTNTIMWLKTQDLVDNHISDWETLMRIEWAAMEYNCSFFQNLNGSICGNVSSFVTHAFVEPGMKPARV